MVVKVNRMGTGNDLLYFVLFFKIYWRAGVRAVGAPALIINVSNKKMCKKHILYMRKVSRPPPPLLLMCRLCPI
jgi:hypothetical protein